jgi:uncharacterized protein
LKININTIPEEGFHLQFERDGEWFRQLLADVDTGGFLLDRLDVSCMVRKIQDNIYIEGNIEVKADMPCSRCLEMTAVFLQAPFKYTFCPPPQKLKEEMELSLEDLDLEYYEGDIINLEQVVFEQVMLQIPMKPLCSESCKGFCPHCGANLNKTTCNCRNEIFDPRLAVLRQINVNH